MRKISLIFALLVFLSVFSSCSNGSNAGQLDDGVAPANSAIATAEPTQAPIPELTVTLFSGNGNLTLPNGDKYIGEFTADEYSGMGTYTFAGGDEFTGNFSISLRDGEGSYKTSDGVIASGRWVKDKPDTLEIRYPDGSKFSVKLTDGKLVNGEYTYTVRLDIGDAETPAEEDDVNETAAANAITYTVAVGSDGTLGSVTALYSSGDRFSTSLTDGIVTSGVFYYAQGDKYEGAYLNGLRNGFGTYTWADSASYTGNWVDDSIVGDGVFKNTEGVQFKGVFVKSKLDSGIIEAASGGTKFVYSVDKGKIDLKTVNVQFANGAKYIGEVSSTAITGKGTFTYPDGAQYVGSVKNGQREGSGVYTWPGGQHYDGKWSADLMNGSGTYYFTSGTTQKLTGTFLNGAPDGSMTYYDTAGKSHKTTWANGKQS